nr:hypothetical protein GCM10020092_024490 [Actinoplanes digitatis]
MASKKTDPEMATPIELAMDCTAVSTPDAEPISSSRTAAGMTLNRAAITAPELALGQGDAGHDVPDREGAVVF